MSGKKGAVIVEINHPDPAFETFRFAVNDTRALKRILTDQNVGEFDHVVCLDQGVTKRQIESNLARMIVQAEPEELVFAYFAEHRMFDNSQQLCLVTNDSESDLPFWTGVPLEHIDRMVRDSKCRSVGLMIDCCYSGPKNETFRGTAPLESLSQFSNQEDSGTSVVISAAQSERVAREIEGLDHGVFAHYLSRDCKEDGDEDVAEEKAGGKIRAK
jgi:hypothetical protein